MGQDKRLLGYARIMRNEPTPLEAKLWKYLSRSQLDGFKFRRQYTVENRAIGDFFCPRKALIVEIDGDTHHPEKDVLRDKAVREYGYVTLRFTNADVGSNIEGVLQAILLKLRGLPDRWPHPNPSPEGEGLDTELLPSPSGEGLGVGKPSQPLQC